MTEKIYPIVFEETEIGVYSCNTLKHGLIGNIVFNDKINYWVFSPIDNFFYSGKYLAIILHKLNELNNYWGEEKNE